jgi:predicted HD phosphohydrolase
LVKKKLDGKHEDIGYEYLNKFFKKDVVEPIKYHVKAKRYLARSKKYYNQLSAASKISLELQGGILNKKESKEFEKNKFFKDAVKLRKFDELAKKTNIKMKSINQYENLLLSQLL